ncbi:MAG: DUF3800 domain-containing protein [Alphaproteobacteria bacterium]
MIIPLHSSPLSVTGHPIDGDRLVRIVLVDEAGISRDDRVTIVAGIIVDVDKQWRMLEERRQSLINQYIPVGDRPGFAFHATELFSGGSYFKRDQWPLQVRLEILKRLLRIIKDAKIPIVVGYCFKSEDESDKKSAQLRHALAYCGLLTGAEHYMRMLKDKNQVAMIIAEDTSQKKNLLKQAHFLIKTEDPECFEYLPRFQPSTKIFGGLQFAEKKDYTLLQLADACAFVFRRSLARLSHAENLRARF